MWAGEIRMDLPSLERWEKDGVMIVTWLALLTLSADAERFGVDIPLGFFRTSYLFELLS
jgi:hypothetical protein